MQLADPKTKKNKCSIDEASHSHGKNDPRYVTLQSKSINLCNSYNVIAISELTVSMQGSLAVEKDILF